jgi:hypothetical protein
MDGCLDGVRKIWYARLSMADLVET